MTTLDELKSVERAIKGYSHPIRKKIIAFLKKERTVSEIIAFIEMTQSEVSQHLKYLRSVDLVSFKKEKSFVKYTLNKSRIDDLLEVVHVLSGVKPTPAKIDEPFKLALKKVRTVNHKIRYEMLEALMKGDAYPSDFIVLFRMEQSETSRHLNILKRNDFVASKTEGKMRKYSANMESITTLTNTVSKYLDKK